MKVAFVTEEEHQVVLDRLAELEQRVAALLKGEAVEAAFLTPKQVASRFRIDTHRVYAALEAGKLRAERRGLRLGGLWRIKPTDADRWYARFEAGRSNQ